MKCLKCHQISDSEFVTCPSCGEVYNRADWQKFEFLEHLLPWLDEHAAMIGDDARTRLRIKALDELDKVRAVLLPPPAPPVPPTLSPVEAYTELWRARVLLLLTDGWARDHIIGEISATALRNLICTNIEQYERQLGARTFTIATPTEAEVTQRFFEILPQLIESRVVTDRDAVNLRSYVDAQQRAPAHAPPPEPIPSPPAQELISPAPPPPSTVAPPISRVERPVPTKPKAAGPAMDWGKLWSQAWNLVVSGAMLRGLLYLGAFMIVISAIVLVLVYWSLFPPLLQLAVVAALPLSFYLAGILLRVWLKLPVAGGVFIGIGALLVGVDFAAVYQLSNLGAALGPLAYWLIASTITTGIFALTAWRLPGEFFGYITWLGVSSTVLALTQFLRLPPEWGIAAVAASGAAMVEVAARVRVSAKWDSLIRATRRLPILVLPLAQIIVLFLPGQSAFGSTLTWGVATIGYTLMAWHFPRAVFAHAAIWSSIVAVSLGTVRWLADLHILQATAWLMAAWAGLALLYMGGAVLLRRAERYAQSLFLWAHLLAPGVLVGLLLNWTRSPDKWFAGPTLVALGATITVYFLSAALHDSHGHPALSRLVSWLPGQINEAIFLWPTMLLIPVWVAVGWTSTPWPPAWLGAAMAGLALAYVGVGQILSSHKMQYRVPVHACAYLVSLVGIRVTMGDAWAYPAALSIAVVAFAALTYVYRRIWEASAAVILFTLAFNEGLALLRLSSGYSAVGWGGLGIAYLLVERALEQAEIKPWLLQFRRPLQAAAPIVWALAWVVALPETARILYGRGNADAFPTILSQVIGTAFVVLAAWRYRSRWPLYLEPWLGIVPVSLAFVAYGTNVFGRPLALPEYALVGLGFGFLHLIAARWVDRHPVRYSHALYFGGYGLAGVALLASFSDRVVNLYALGAAILIALASQVLVDRGQHLAFDDFVRLIWRQPGTAAERAVRTVFLFFAAYAFPLWLIQLLVHFQVPPAWQGCALALTAPVYLAAGLMARRIRGDYAWPLYSAAYALTAIGAMVAFDNELLAIWVLVLDAVVYAVSAYIFRQSFWLYLSNTLVPVAALVSLHYRHDLTSMWVTLIFMGIAFVYAGIGYGFERRKAQARAGVAPFALPFLAPGYLLSAVAQAVASGDQDLALYVFPAGVVLYAVSAWAFREPLFLYPAAALTAVPYFIAMTHTALAAEWRGLGWLPLIVLYIAVGRLAFHQSPIDASLLRPGTVIPALQRPAMPFYLVGYALSVHMIMLSQKNMTALTLALAAATVLYFSSAVLFRRAAWVYPALAALHLALLAALSLYPKDQPAYYVSIPFLGLTWLVALAGVALSQSAIVTPARLSSGGSLAKYLTQVSWARPFLVVACIDLVVWQVVALGGSTTAIVLGAGNALLLVLFACLWRDRALPYGALVFASIAVGYYLSETGMAIPDQLAWMGGIGFALYFVARIAERLDRFDFVAIWVKPLSHASVFFTAAAVLLTLPTVLTHMTASAAALALAGALYLAIAYQNRYRALGYLGLALLEVAWVLVLLAREIREPQLYAIPAGLYFVCVGYLERRRARQGYATTLISLGLAVPLLTSFIQSLNGMEGFPYFVLLVIEGLVVIWWGGVLRCKVPFFIGLGASALNVVAQVAVLVNVYAVDRFAVIFMVGVLLVSAAVLVERQHTRILARAQVWREALETWE